MRIAVPTENGMLCPHFGNCPQFSFIDVDPEKKEILKVEMVTPPPHQPGLLPVWINEQGCNLIIAGGMGMRANMIFQQNGIEVVTGALNRKPEELVMDYLNGVLVSGVNFCSDPGFKSQGGHDCKNHGQD